MRFGVEGAENCQSSGSIFFAGASSVQDVRHINSSCETQLLEKRRRDAYLKQRESEKLRAECFDVQSSQHECSYISKGDSSDYILDRSMNTILIEPSKKGMTKECAYRPSKSSTTIASSTFPSLFNTSETTSTPSTSFTLDKPTMSFTGPSLTNTSTKPLCTSNSSHSPTSLPPPTTQNISVRQSSNKEIEQSVCFKSSNTNEHLKQNEGVVNDVDTTEAVNQTMWSFSSEYFEDDMEAIKVSLSEASIFESKSGITIRGLIKRSILEKVTVNSKKLATEEEKHDTWTFFSLLLSSKEVVGFEKKRLVVKESHALHYAMHVIVESYLNLLHRDPALSDTVSSILLLVAHMNTSFASFLRAFLLSRSSLLDLDSTRSSSFVDSLLTQPEGRHELIGNHKAAALLYFGLHCNSASRAISSSPFPLSSLWRYSAHLLNRSHNILATSIMMDLLLQIAGAQLKGRYGRQWEKILFIMKCEMINKLQKQLQNDYNACKAGTAQYISALGNTIDKHMIS